jgi:hypothetical protein
LFQKWPLPQFEDLAHAFPAPSQIPKCGGGSLGAPWIAGKLKNVLFYRVCRPPPSGIKPVAAENDEPLWPYTIH